MLNAFCGYGREKESCSPLCRISSHIIRIAGCRRYRSSGRSRGWNSASAARRRQWRPASPTCRPAWRRLVYSWKSAHSTCSEVSMKVYDLLNSLQGDAAERRAVREFTVRLPLHDAARLLALAEMYPGRTETLLVGELLSAAIDELEAAFPYVQGSAVVAEDDHGDPIYEDSGLTPRLIALTRKHLRALEREIIVSVSGAD